MFYDPKTGYLSFEKFFEKVKKEHPDIPKESVREFVEKYKNRRRNKKVV